MNEFTDGIWIIDALGRTVYANRSMAGILGTESSTMIGESSFSYVFPEDMAAAQRLFASKKEGDPAPFRFKLRRKGGDAIAVVVQGTPMHDANGEFQGVVGMFTVSDDDGSLNRTMQ
ncbi:MAG TPA: PAS domain-containing protein [Terracidiphilus sp.]|nr:PAS domain-containing protein [Terracidiphilus sp.]